MVGCVRITLLVDELVMMRFMGWRSELSLLVFWPRLWVDLGVPHESLTKGAGENVVDAAIAINSVNSVCRAIRCLPETHAICCYLLFVGAEN